MNQYIKTISLFILLFVSIAIQSQTIESDTIAEVLHHVDNETLVIFDIDNTLVCPEKELGSDEWFSYKIKEKMQEGFDINQAIHAILPTYFYIAFHNNLKSCEPTTAKIIKKIKAHGAHVISLTARFLYLAERTVKLLREIDITFDLPSVQQEEIILPMPIPAIFKHGMLFSGNNDKGETLLCLLDNIQYHPKKIIFVDDKEKNIYSVENAAIKRQIPFVGIRYAGSDEKVKNFNPQEAEQQLQAFIAEHIA